MIFIESISKDKYNMEINPKLYSDAIHCMCQGSMTLNGLPQLNIHPLPICIEHTHSYSSNKHTVHNIIYRRDKGD